MSGAARGRASFACTVFHHKRRLVAIGWNGPVVANYGASMKTASKNHLAFTLVEIMIVVAIIALLASIAVPGFLRARKRAQASRILNDLRLIDAAIDQYAIETNKMSGATVNTVDWTNYMKKGSSLYNTGANLFGHGYGVQNVDSLPKCPASTWTALSDVADTNFWSPYGHN
jgi:prepilin-type N-terminal cleavage/methylation domain-containing protein